LGGIANMFYIFVEIFSWKQLVKLEKQEMLEMDRRIRDIINAQGGAETGLHPHLFVFSSYYEESMCRIIDSLFLLQTLLKEYENTLHGFSILMTSLAERESLHLRQIERLCYKTGEDQSIWLDECCREECASFVNWESYPGILKALSPRSRGPLLPERREILCQRTDLEEFLNNQVKETKVKENQQLILIKNQNPHEYKSAIQYWVNNQKFDTNILYISGLSKDQSYSPFFDSLNMNILLWGKNGWGANPLWELLEEINCKDFGKIRRDRFIIDFKDAYSLYLNCFNMFCQSLGVPVIYLISSYNEMTNDAKELLHWIINRKIKKQQILYILEIDKDMEEWKSNVETVTYQLNPLTRKEVTTRMDQAFPDSSWQSKMKLDKWEGYLSAHQWFIAGQLSESGLSWESPEQGVQELFNSLADPLKMIYLFIARYPQWATIKIIENTIPANEMDASRIKDFLERLVYMSLIQECPGGMYRALWSQNIKINSDEFVEIDKKVNQILKERWNENNRIELFYYLNQLEEKGKGTHFLVALEFILDWLLDNHMFSTAESLIDRNFRSPQDCKPDFEESLQNLKNGARIRLALLDSEWEELEERIIQGDLSLVTAKGDYADFFSLQIARYYLSAGFPDQSLNFSKEALFGFQKNGNHTGEVYANTELALSLLAQKKLGAALDYFEIARRIAWQMSQHYGLLLCSSLECIGIFLFGNLSLALRNIDSLLDICIREGRRDREFFLSFLKGRILFELGNYEGACNLFHSLKSRSIEYSYNQCGNISAHWEARSLIYQNKTHQAYGLLNGDQADREELFFLAEADFMEGRYEAAMMKLEQASKTGYKMVYNHSEKENWINGFQPIEGWFLSEESDIDVLDEQIEGLKYFLLGKKGQHNEAIQGLQRLMRREDFPFHPYSHKYYYLLSQVVRNQPETERSDDQLVHLSRAIEKLQSRAGRFDDQKTKLGYLNKNYWNSKIIEEAHKKKFL